MGGKLASTQIIICVHICAVAERRRGGSKNRSARNGSNTQFTAPASKPRAPNHHCPQEMADPPASAPRMCEHTRGSGAGISKSARLRSATAPRMYERSLTNYAEVWECRRFGLSTFRFVDVLVCRRFGLSTFRFVDALVCRRFGLSTFRFVDVSVCRRFGLSTIRFVDVLVCRRFGCRRFGLSTFWLVTRQIRGLH